MYERDGQTDCTAKIIKTKHQLVMAGADKAVVTDMADANNGEQRLK